MERTLLIERVKESLKYKKEVEHIKLGRPKLKEGCYGKSKLDNFKEEIISLRKNGSTLVCIGKKYGVSTPTVSYFLKTHMVEKCS